MIDLLHDLKELGQFLQFAWARSRLPSEGSYRMLLVIISNRSARLLLD